MIVVLISALIFGLYTMRFERNFKNIKCKKLGILLRRILRCTLIEIICSNIIFISMPNNIPISLISIIIITIIFGIIIQTIKYIIDNSEHNFVMLYLNSLKDNFKYIEKEIDKHSKNKELSDKYMILYSLLSVIIKLLYSTNVYNAVIIIQHFDLLNLDSPVDILIQKYENAIKYTFDHLVQEENSKVVFLESSIKEIDNILNEAKIDYSIENRIKTPKENYKNGDIFHSM